MSYLRILLLLSCPTAFHHESDNLPRVRHHDADVVFESGRSGRGLLHQRL